MAAAVACFCCCFTGCCFTGVGCLAFCFPGVGCSGRCLLLRPCLLSLPLLLRLLPWRARRLVQLRRELLPAQCPFHQIRGACGGNEAVPLAPVGGEHRVHPAHREHVAELGPGRAVSLARTLHAGDQVAPGQRGESDGMALQHPVQPVVGRDRVQQPCHGGPLEPLAARRVNPSWPSGWQIRSHGLTIADYRTGVLVRADGKRRCPDGVRHTTRAPACCLGRNLAHRRCRPGRGPGPPGPTGRAAAGCCR